MHFLKRGRRFQTKNLFNFRPFRAGAAVAAFATYRATLAGSCRALLHPVGVSLKFKLGEIQLVVNKKIGEIQLAVCVDRMLLA